MPKNKVAVKTHLIIKSIHNEYKIKWFGKFAELKPLIRNDKLVFVVISADKRVELNTCNMKDVEEIAKKIASPHGREAVTVDTSNIYIKQEDETDIKVGSVTKYHIKKFAPMYDKFEWR